MRKPFQYPVTRPRNYPSLRPPPARKIDEEQELTGYIMGMKASDIEERFARALSYLGLNFGFRVQVANMGGQPVVLSQNERNQLGAIEMDFFVERYGRFQPIQIDGEYSHKSSVQKEEDARKDASLNNLLKAWSALPVTRVPYYFLKDQDSTNRKAKEILL